MHRILQILTFLSLSPALYSQDTAPDTLLVLKDVTISTGRIQRFATGLVTLGADSLVRSQFPAGTLSELAPTFSSAYVRNYGPGTLSTLSFRGTSANHASVYWNGTRLAQPNIGYLDLSLVQNVFFDDVAILAGGSTPMFGSGAIGGSLHLENHPVFDHDPLRFEAGLTAGSFRTMAAEGKVQLSRKRVYSRSAFSLFGTQNNFSYRDDAGEKKELTNAAVSRAGFIQDLAFLLPGGQYIMASTWFQYADREIPPTLTGLNSDASQLDRSWRSMIAWKDVNERSNLEARVAYYNEFTRYQDSLTAVYSVIETQTLSGNFEGTWLLAKNSMVFSGVNYTYEYADLDYYASAADQQGFAVYASFRQDIPAVKWQLSLNARQEFITGFKVPFLFSIGMEGKIWKQLTGRVHFSRNYRAPTLNERFWQPGGNPELEPEESWGQEAGLGWDGRIGPGTVGVKATFFNAFIENWILWLPGSGFWSVENAQEVRSRGAELIISWKMPVGKWLFHLSGSYTYSKSTNEKKLFEYDASYHKQLIYTPLNKLNLLAGVEFRRFHFTLRGNYTGLIYTTRDNQASLPGYFILDAVFSKVLTFKKSNDFTLLLNMNNILDKNYQVTPDRPMPGFNILVTLRASLSNDRINPNN